MKLDLVRQSKGTYITIENQMEGSHFYIIKKGRVKVFSSITGKGSSLNKNLGPGDFFSVISCMTNRARLQSSYVLEDCELLVVKKNQFSLLIEKSAPLALRILRSFSNDLRKYDEELVKKTLKSIEQVNSEQIFFNQGVYYFEKAAFLKAAYIFIQFLKNHVNSSLVPEAKSYLSKIDKEYIAQLKFPYGATRVYLDKDMLFCDAEPGYEMFILEQGRIKIHKIVGGKEVIIAVLNKGDIFGEMALLNNKERTASAEAFGEVRCTAFNSGNFNDIFKGNAALGLRIVILLSERIWTIYKQLDNLYFSDCGARIVDTLVTYLLKEKISIESGGRYSFSFGQDELMKMIGVEEEKFDVAFNRLLEEGLIYVDNGKLHCRDVLALQKEVEFARKMEQRNRNMNKISQSG